MEGDAIDWDDEAVQLGGDLGFIRSLADPARGQSRPGLGDGTASPGWSSTRLLGGRSGGSHLVDPFSGGLFFQVSRPGLRARGLLERSLPVVAFTNHSPGMESPLISFR
jgi:hypothetical protein